MCVDELKRRGIEFELLKEVDALQWAKSFKVEMRRLRRCGSGPRGTLEHWSCLSSRLRWCWLLGLFCAVT